ncbi:MAG: amidohydrolase family protein [Lentisphaeria bacterium]|nr:amidohydrolase family protein [Lentisphaeria bacterium]
MIVDADVHISPTPEGGNSIGVEELLRCMDRAGVDRALTWLQPPYRREVDDANAYVARAAGEHPDRILGFGWADPNLGLDRARATVRRCLDEYGFAGVKLNGAQRVCFGSDTPFALMHVEVAKYRALLEDVPPEEAAAVMGENILRVLTPTP